jgi:hypothetical protein
MSNVSFYPCDNCVCPSGVCGRDMENCTQTDESVVVGFRVGKPKTDNSLSSNQPEINR